MSKVIVIALTGPAGAGKDTVADTLVTHAGFTKLAFADALRLEIAAAFGLGAHQYGVLSDRATKEHPTPLLALMHCHDDAFFNVAYRMLADDGTVWAVRERSPRQIMQWWGTEYRRAQDPDYWVRRLGERVADLMVQGERRFVVSDCRFVNEARTIRSMGGEVWRVLRPGAEHLAGQHLSETEGMTITPELTLHNGAGIIDLAHTTLRALTSRHGGAVLPDDLVEQP